MKTRERWREGEKERERECVCACMCEMVKERLNFSTLFLNLWFLSRLQTHNGPPRTPSPLSLPVSLRLQGVEYPVNRSQTAENYLDILENHLKNTSASMKENK